MRAPFISRHLLFGGNVTVYLTSVLDATSVSSSIIHSLLQLETTVSFWNSLLPLLPSLPATDRNQLMSTLNVAVVVKKITSLPTKIRVQHYHQFLLIQISFLATPLVQADDALAVSPFNPNKLFPLPFS